jgi:beta-galactosidase
MLQCWDNEAIYLQEAERHELQEAPSNSARGTKNQPNRAYVGLARALINHQVPYEYVTSHEILEGVALCYPVLYLPHLRAVPAKVMEALIDYVTRGGRLVADVQVAFEDQYGKMHPTGPGGLQERSFGAYVDMIHDVRTNPMSLNGIAIEGFYGDLVATRARVLARFADGTPAITEAQIGRGSAVLIGFDAARMCWKPGQSAVERLIASLVMGDDRAGWECSLPMTYRLSGAGTDHYFLINDGPACTAFIKAYDRCYRSGEYVIEQKPLPLGGMISVDVPEASAVWLRLERKE